jgi:polyhydroxyalkanoate synthesis repressor PhaR
MNSVRLIKRYANRKLYDTTDSRYIKLDEIAEILDRGEELRIIDNETKEDITRITLAQILVRRGRTGSLGDSMTSLRGLIVSTGEQLSKRITDPVYTLRSSVEESVNKFLKTGEERAVQSREQFHAWVAQNTLAIDELQRRLDERVRTAITRLDLGGQLTMLRQRIEVLEAALGIESPVAPASDTESDLPPE